MIISEIITASPSETEACGAQLAELILSDISQPSFIAMYGDLGVGKTAFVRGFTSVISPGSSVKSPTFSLVNEYKAKPRSIFHFDMYRITNDDELYSIGFYDYLENGICIAEWSENIPFGLPERFFRVTISKTSPDSKPDERKITVEII